MPINQQINEPNLSIFTPGINTQTSSTRFTISPVFPQSIMFLSTFHKNQKQQKPSCPRCWTTLTSFSSVGLRVRVKPSRILPKYELSLHFPANATTANVGFSFEL